jgi:long-chain acyl-CoA synthetase
MIDVVADLDIPARIRSVVSIDPDANALQFDGSWRSWRYHADALEQLDRHLLDAGVPAGATVGVVMRNLPEVVRTVVALLGTNRCVVTLSSAIPTPALADEIGRLRPPVVVGAHADATSAAIVAACRDAGSMLLEARDDGPAYAQVVPLEQSPSAVRAAVLSGVAVRMLTSGTTGTPKRVDLRYESIAAEMTSVIRSTRQRDANAPAELSNGVAILWNPILHIGGMRSLIQSLVEGRAISLLERFDVHAWAGAVREHRPRAISLVPTALRMVYEADLPRDAFAGVKACFVGTAPLDPALGASFHERYGVPILVVYGATEFAGGVAGWTLRDWERFGDTKWGSVGRANAGIELRVIDDERGAPVPNGTEGILEVRGRQLPEPGWMRTTDLAVLDDDGFLWIRGRADDVIIRGGFKVSTDAVRDALVGHAAVRDAVVIGIPDERLGAVPVAAVEVEPHHDVDEEALRQYLRGHLAAYQIPMRILVVERLPRTPSMKVSQPAVRELFDGSV